MLRMETCLLILYCVVSVVVQSLFSEMLRCGRLSRRASKQQKQRIADIRREERRRRHHADLSERASYWFDARCEHYENTNDRKRNYNP